MERARQFRRLLGPAVVSVALLGSRCAGQIPADFQQGLELYQAKQYGSAVECFERIVSTNPEWAGKASHRIGLCYQKQRQFGLAIARLARALQCADPTDSRHVLNIRLALIECYADNNEVDKAWPLVQELSLSMPEKATFLLAHGCVVAGECERGAAAAIYGLVSIEGVEHIGPYGLPSWLMADGDPKTREYVRDACTKIVSDPPLVANAMARADLQGMLECCGQALCRASAVDLCRLPGKPRCSWTLPQTTRRRPWSI